MIRAGRHCTSHWLSGLLAALLALTVVSGCSLSSGDVRTFDRPGSLAAYQQGNRAFAAGDVNGAVDAYTRAIALDPSWPEPFNNRGLAYIRLRLYQDAVEDLIRAVTASDGDPDMLYNLGTAQLQRGFLEHAREALEDSLAARPGNVDAENNLAVVLTRLGEFERADELLRGILAAHPDNVNALSNLGALRDAQGDAEGAERAYMDALALNGDQLDALRNLAFLFLRDGREAEAVPYLERFLALAPPGSDVSRERGMVERLRAQ